MGHPHYSAARGGILALTRTVAKELIQQGIRVNAIAPGFVDTQLVSGFLCCDDASFFVGETISPKGGFVTV